MVGGGIDGAAGVGIFLIEAVDWRAVVGSPAEFDAEAGGGGANFGDHEVEGAIKIASVIAMGFGRVVVGKDALVS